MSPGPQAGHKPPYNAKQGGFSILTCDSNRNQQLLADTILPKMPTAVPSVFTTFWDRFQMDKGPLSDYSIVNFSTFSFQN